MKLSKELLESLYVDHGLSVSQISNKLHVSQGQINYWLAKFKIQKRSIKVASYKRLNPEGDPFSIKAINNIDEAFLLGLGLGLYWGEGTKRNLNAVRLGNTDPYLVKSFILFLRRLFSIDEARLRFSLQIFSDMDKRKEEKFWREFLNVPQSKFYKTVVTKSGKIGTYKQKSAHGVLTVYFHNTKLRDYLVQEIERMKTLG